MNKTKLFLLKSLGQLLYPLAKILLRFGISHEEFNQIAKKIFIDVAQNEREFSIDGRKQSTAHISVLTGIQRKEVARLRETEQLEELDFPDQNRGKKVVNAWLRESKYRDDEGVTLDLPLEDATGPSFSLLVKEHSGDMTVRALLDELLRVGAVRQLDNQKFRLSSDAYIPHKDAAEKLKILGESASDLIRTIEHNMQHELDQSRLQMTLAYNNLPQEALSEFKQLSEHHAHQILLLLNDWLAKQDRDVNPSIEGTGRYRAGLGIYYFESPDQEDSDRED